MSRKRFIRWGAVFIVGTVLPALLIVYLHRQLTVEQRKVLGDLLLQHPGFFLVSAGVLMTAGAVTLVYIVRRLFIPLHRIAEAIPLISAANPRHRIRPRGIKPVKEIIHRLNDMAERFEQCQTDDARRTERIKNQAEKERNILSAIMAELPEGIIVCNVEGAILLYNQRARHLFTGNADPASGASPVFGLGRSVYQLISSSRITHCLDTIIVNLERGDDSSAAHFVTAGGSDDFLRVEMGPILDSSSTLTGYILIITDITEELKTGDRINANLRLLATEIRSAAANIRASIETILQYPRMPTHQLKQFREIIYSEALALGSVLDHSAARWGTLENNGWPLMPTPINTLMHTIQQKTAETLDINLKVTNHCPEAFVNADSYSLCAAATFVLLQLSADGQRHAFSCRLERQGPNIHFKLGWNGQPVKIEQLREWENSPIRFDNDQLPFTLKEVLDHHHTGVITDYRNAQIETAALHFFLPAGADGIRAAGRRPAILPHSQPEFYNFDLFAATKPDTDNRQRLLSDLNYTVFDTETTGLDPNIDEIVSIAAVRIVKGRLLREEIFETRVNPGRPVPPSATLIHGITDAMLDGQPPITTVLPRFHDFAADTVIIAHNAAFDMRIITLKESIAGVTFNNPILDTLLLSAVIHPSQDDHTLERIAKRLGVAVVGRHTAKGDAIATAKMFLKMIPLLADKGIFTLSDAISAARKTYYARMRY